MLKLNSHSEFIEYFHYKICEFLTADFYESVVEQRNGKDYVPDDELDIFFPETLIRENHEKYEKVALDLYFWACDDKTHPLDALHEFALYNFLLHMENHDEDFLKEVYFSGPEDEEMINQAWQKFDKKSNEYIRTKNDLRDFLHDITILVGACFDDIDFITFSNIISDGMVKGEEVPQDLLDEYIDLIPPDIVKYYQSIYQNENSLFNNLNIFLDHFAHNLKYNHSFYDMLWPNNSPASEPKAQDFIGTQLISYCWCNKIMCDREVDTGSGDVDFRVRNATEEVFIEIKLARHPRLRTGLTKQLIRYMEAANCHEAFYLIFCYTDKELTKAQKLIDELSGTLNRKIIIKIMDARQKTVASKLK